MIHFSSNFTGVKAHILAMKKIAFILVIALGIVSCGKSQPTEEAHADILLINAQVYTVNSNKPWAEAVAITGEKISFVGTVKDAMTFKGMNTQVVDLHGGMLLPGFIDSHSHILLGGAHVDDLVLDPFDTPEHWILQVEQFAKEQPGSDVIVAVGFLASRFGQTGPTRQMLDHINKPVFILDEGMHGAWLNSLALQRLGINRNTPDPLPGFDYYKRDTQGEPTGYLLEGTVWQALANLKIQTPESLAIGTSKVINYYNAAGVTSVFDAGPWEVEEVQAEILAALDKESALTIYFSGSYYIDDAADINTVLDKVLALKQKTLATPYKIQTLKIMVDGTVEGRTAAMFEDYQGDPGNKGETVLTPEQLNHLVASAVSKDIDIHFHALGERAISESLDAIALAKQAYPHTQVRFTISHIQVMSDRDIARFKALDVIAQASLLWAEYDSAGKAFVSDDQFQRYYRLQSLASAGVRLTFGNDYPSSGSGVAGISPLLNIEVGLTRQAPGEPDAPIQDPIAERLNLAQLIKGYTLDGAYQLRQELETGSIEVGKYADLVLLDKNLFETDPYQIHAVKVRHTWRRGQLVYSVDGQQ